MATSNRIVSGLSPIITGLDSLANDPLFKECPQMLKGSVTNSLNALRNMKHLCQDAITSNGEKAHNLTNDDIESAKKEVKRTKTFAPG